MFLNLQEVGEIHFTFDSSVWNKLHHICLHASSGALVHADGGWPYAGLFSGMRLNSLYLYVSFYHSFLPPSLLSPSLSLCPLYLPISLAPLYHSLYFTLIVVYLFRILEMPGEIHKLAAAVMNTSRDLQSCFFLIRPVCFSAKNGCPGKERRTTRNSSFPVWSLVKYVAWNMTMSLIVNMAQLNLLHWLEQANSPKHHVRIWKIKYLFVLTIHFCGGCGENTERTHMTVWPFSIDWLISC